MNNFAFILFLYFVSTSFLALARSAKPEHGEVPNFAIKFDEEAGIMKKRHISANTCASSPCLNGSNDNPLFRCSCPPGYKARCEKEIDPCESSPCQNGGKCTSQGQTYNCTCLSCYEGKNCESERDPCKSSPCQNGGECISEGNAYTCKCSSGYNGLNCKVKIDVNECATNPCHANATCNNTMGSFSCACNTGYTGDGLNCAGIISSQPECTNHSRLTDANRNEKDTSNTVLCDSGLSPGWYRFGGKAGTRMPTTCVTVRRCGTHAPGWINGTHPTVSDGKITRTVCFHWSGNCCRWSTSIEVLNCGYFYIYKFTSFPSACSLRYCGSDN